MRVILKRNYFVGGVRYRKSISNTPVELPDKYFDILPSSAIVVEPPAGKVPSKDAPKEVPVEDALEKAYVNPAHDLDMERVSAEAEDKINEKAKANVKSIREQYKKKGK